jgi:chromosome segregation ATPase
MASLSALNGTPSGMALTVAAYQSRLQQARAQAAQAQADVRALESETQQARQRAGQADQQVRAIQSHPPREQQAPLSAPVSLAAQPQTRLNTLGQTTGSRLNAVA